MCVYVQWYSVFFFFKQKTAYEMRISDWSSDVCSSDLWASPSALSAARTPPRSKSNCCTRPPPRRGARRPTIITKASPPFSIGVRLVSKDDEHALMDAAPVSAGLLDRHLGRSGGGGGKNRDTQHQREADAQDGKG